ncbi:MAG: TlpA family protein disulfide reductase [Oscillospiraceae bacterium]|nr:TlpA family protein disulfide reductase [Oscillospiraceae bacterium]
MKKWHTVVLALSLVALIAAAGFLYNTLKDRAGNQQLMTAPTAQQTEAAEEQTLPTQQQTQPAAESTEPSETVDMTAPDFTVYDGEGNPVTLESLRGKPVILNFWATWCGYCVMEMPEFQTMYDTYGEQIHFMMVNVTDGYQETQEAASGFITEKGFTFPVYYDLELSAASAYGVNAMPVTYFIGENGDLVAYGQGALDASAIQQGIDMLLGE